MTSIQVPASLHIETLQIFLSAPERAENCFTFYQLLGAIVATECSPQYISDIDLGYLVLGGQVCDYELWFNDERVRTAWVQLVNELSEQLARQTYDLKEQCPLGNEGIIPTPLAQWCDGYLQGYCLTETQWDEAYQELEKAEFLEETVQKLRENHHSLLAIMATFADFSATLKSHHNPQELIDCLPFVYNALKMGILNQHRIAQTIEDMSVAEKGNAFLSHSSPYEQREKDDLCHCGSGKSFKKCCLH